MHSGALDGLRESSSAVLDFRLLGEGLEGKDFFSSQNEPLKAKLSDAPKIATSFHLLMSAHIGGGLWGEREVPRESPPLCLVVTLRCVIVVSLNKPFQKHGDC